MSAFDNNRNPYRSSFRRRDDRIRTPQARRFQKRREKIPPHPPKPCFVYQRDGSLPELALNWDEKAKRLYFDAGVFYRFPSRKAAHDAVWNTCFQDQQDNPGVNIKDLMARFEIINEGEV